MPTTQTEAMMEETEHLGGAGAEHGPPPSGLARGIRALFQERAAPPGERTGGSAFPPVSARDARGRFTTRVARYLRADSEDRERLVPGILEDAATLRAAHEVRAVADAVVALALADGDDGEERGTVELATRLSDSAVLQHLAVRLGTDRDPEVRSTLTSVALIVPHLLAGPIADALAEAPDRGVRRALMDVLILLGDHGRNAVLQLLGDPRWYAARNGVILLSEIPDGETVQALTIALAHPDPRVRSEALMALAKIGGADAGSLIVGMLHDPSPDVRAAAAIGAGSLRVVRAHRPLLELLGSEENEETLVQVLEALGQLADPGAVPAIEKKATGSLFSRPPRPVRVAAYRALAAMGTPHARSVLEAATSDRDPEVRQAVDGILKSAPRAGGGATAGIPGGSTAEPSEELSTEPSARPSEGPSAEPSEGLSAEPSEGSAAEPSTEPSAEPSTEPSARPAEGLPAEPSESPPTEPSEGPSVRLSEGNEPTSEPADPDPR